MFACNSQESLASQSLRLTNPSCTDMHFPPRTAAMRPPGCITHNSRPSPAATESTQDSNTRSSSLPAPCEMRTEKARATLRWPRPHASTLLPSIMVRHISCGPDFPFMSMNASAPTRPSREDPRRSTRKEDPTQCPNAQNAKHKTNMARIMAGGWAWAPEGKHRATPSAGGEFARPPRIGSPL